MMSFIISIVLLLAICVVRVPAVVTWLAPYPYIVGAYMVGIFFLVFFTLPKAKRPTALSMRKQIFFQATAGALIYISISFFLGALLAEIKRSPYDISVLGIINNILMIVPVILAREAVRDYIIANTWRNRWAFRIFSVLIVFVLSDLNLPNLQQLKSRSEILIFIAQYTVPALATGILLTTLSYFGGFRSSLAYALTFAIFTRMFPFLPDLTWLAESAVGIIFPILFAMYIRDGVAVKERGRKEKQESITSGYIASLVFTILIIWFSVGVFPIYPSVILTGSMEPLIKPGDMILIKKVSSQEEIENYQVGDIINFRRENINITHRIIAVLVDEQGNYSFRTKGDNNLSEDDDIVELTEVNGKHLYTIPKIGIPALIIRSYQGTPEGVVDKPEATNKIELE